MQLRIPLTTAALLLLTLLATQPSDASDDAPSIPPAPFRTGRYISDDGEADVTVRPTYDGYFEIEATGMFLPYGRKRNVAKESQYFSFEFNPTTRTALKIYSERYHFRVLSQESTPELVRLVMQAGSRKTPHELHVDFSYDPRTGVIHTLSGRSIISEYSLPGGSHWGPRKVIFHIPCVKLLSVHEPVDGAAEAVN